MPENKDLKRLVRERMTRTGERYTQALVAISGAPIQHERRSAADLDRLVQLLARKDRRIQAIIDLVGGITATELRQMDVPDDIFDALLRGLRDPNAKVRWWCIQLLDHVPDERALWAVVPLLDDPVDRVRRNAVHTLGCLACKPTADAALPSDLLDKVRAMAAADPSAKVRNEAAYALSCRT